VGSELTLLFANKNKKKLNGEAVKRKGDTSIWW